MLIMLWSIFMNDAEVPGRLPLYADIDPLCSDACNLMHWDLTGTSFQSALYICFILWLMQSVFNCLGKYQACSTNFRCSFWALFLLFVLWKPTCLPKLIFSHFLQVVLSWLILLLDGVVYSVRLSSCCLIFADSVK